MKYRFIILTLLACLWAPAGANAQDILTGIGGRVGATIDPDQIHFGIHTILGELTENLELRPNIEVGAGSNLTLVAVNPEVAYRFPQTGKNYVPYAGGGIGLNFLDHRGSSPGTGGSSFEVGLNILGGLEFEATENSNLFIEAKLGVGDSPDVKFTFGFTLKR